MPLTIIATGWVESYLRRLLCIRIHNPVFCFGLSTEVGFDTQQQLQLINIARNVVVLVMGDGSYISYCHGRERSSGEHRSEVG